MRTKLIPWLAGVFWMVMIFLFSGQTGDDSGRTSTNILQLVVKLLCWNFETLPGARQAQILETWHVIIRKGAHFAEYAVLGGLISNALRGFPRLKSWKWVISIGASALYAVTDEIHQYFVPDRACRFLDVCIDTAGAAFGTVIFAIVMYLTVNYKENHKNDQKHSL